jgi:DNA-binding transcriptional ArsR family regulator
MKLNERQQHFDLTLTALAHPARRAILERVMHTELRVTELARPFAMSLNAVSKHIRILERAGLVSRRRIWREHLVSFNSDPLEQVSAWIEKSRAFWSARLDALDALLKAEDAAATQQPDKKKKGKPK